MKGSDSSFSRLSPYCRPWNFAVGPVLDPPDHIVHTWWCIFTYKEPQYQTSFCMDFGISLGTIALRIKGVHHIVLAGRSTDQATGCMWQLGSWHCMSNPYDPAAGRISTWLNPKSTSLSSYSMGRCKDMHLEQLSLSKLRGKSHKRKTEQRIEEVSKAFSRSSQVIWLCACPLLVFGNRSCLKSVKLLFEGVTLVVMLC